MKIEVTNDIHKDEYEEDGQEAKNILLNMCLEVVEKDIDVIRECNDERSYAINGDGSSMCFTAYYSCKYDEEFNVVEGSEKVDIKIRYASVLLDHIKQEYDNGLTACCVAEVNTDFFDEEENQRRKDKIMTMCY